MTEEAETETKKVELILKCEACDQPLKLVHLLDDDQGWLAECSDPRCAALHQGCF